MHDEPGILGEEGRRRIMMTMTLRIALVLVSLGTFSLMMRKIRQSKLQIESAIFWIVFSIVLVVFSIFPSVADFASRLLGIYATTNFLFLFAIFLLIVKVFYMTIHISQLETRVKELVQQMALEKNGEKSRVRCRNVRAGAQRKKMLTIQKRNAGKGYSTVNRTAGVGGWSR